MQFLAILKVYVFFFLNIRDKHKFMLDCNFPGNFISFHSALGSAGEGNCIFLQAIEALQITNNASLGINRMERRCDHALFIRNRFS